jgi:RNA polymerase sigma-70 factor (ECF subfamily)
VESSDAEITELALAARDGDRAALEQFVQTTQRDVWMYVASLVSVSAADDLTAKAYSRALRDVRWFTARSSARVWLLAIARREVADHLRWPQEHEQPAGTVVVDFQRAVQRRKPHVRRGEERMPWEGQVHALSPERREAFLLTQALGLSYAEAGRVCDCAVSAIRSRVARAREDLITMVPAPGSSTEDRLLFKPSWVEVVGQS